MIAGFARQNFYDKPSKGFTTIELLLILVVVLILGGLVATNYQSVQEHTRDNTRRSDITILQGDVEIYQAETGEYPTLANLNSNSFRSAHFKDFDNNVLKDPRGKLQILVATPKAHAYAYQPQPAGCTNAGDNVCTGYILTATLEQGGIYVKRSP